ncbi:hypothetical protein CPB84DRAFT_194171 [Gymnopilus junonius]|uniref:Uncharacterized protein n=1 Tax=Gymnopilus junonius TaxID=109634 RepID=A0A9P5NG86_GYMJU|nr:hypothetical protein CPB84DRAFT_194171 [Gymnopilus junonius]
MQCIAIGHFKEDGDTPHEIVQTDTGCVRRIPDGKDVETGLVTDTDCGEFRFVVHRKLDEDGNIIETKEEKLSRTGSSNYIHRELAREEISTGNFFLSEGCFHYLQAWLDYCRVPKPHHDRKLTFSGELFEIVNSRKEGRDYTTGALPYINYDGIENTLQQEQYEASENMKVPERTIASIRNGDPPHQILDSISRDCRAWMFRAPDMWPVADEDLVREVASKFTPANAIDILRALPNEVFLHHSIRRQHPNVSRSSENLKMALQ